MSSSHVHRTPDKALSSQFTRPIKQGALTSSIEKLLYHGQFGRSFNRKESMPAIPELDFQDDEMLNILKPLEGSESNAPLYDLKLDQLRAPIDMFPYLPGKYCRKTPDCEISDLNDDSKVEAMYSMSLEVIIDKLVKKPLRTQIRLVNESIINHFIVDLQLNKEFASLRQFLFLEDGEFARTFLTALFVKVTDPQHLCEVVNASFLTNTLNAAIESSLNPTFISERLSLNLVRFPEFQDLVETVSFDFLQFHYKVHWPVNIILTKKAIQMYNKVLTFLIQIKYAAWALTEIYYKLRRDGRVESGREKELHCLELYRHEMNHFVRSLESYICHQVCQVTWSELQADLSSPINHLDHLKEIHSQYLTRAMYRCLISHKMARVQQVIVNLLKEVHNFRRSLSFHLWPADASQPHPGWKQMQMSMQKFREYARFLYKLVCEMVKRGDHQRGHLHELKMRLNMNGYFDRM